MPEKSTPRSLRAKHVSWLTILLGLATIVSFFAISGNNTYVYPVMRGVAEYMGGGTTNSIAPMPSSKPSAPSMLEGASTQSSAGYGGGSRAYAPDYYPYYNGNVPVTDTREFQKVYYNADMQTRDPQALERRVVTIVRGHGGRVDNESASPKYGSVTFAVPVSKYDAFRDELESLVGSRFLQVNISSQNMLPQKQSIEEQQKQADDQLAQYQSSRQKLVSSHSATVASLQGQIDADERQLAVLQAGPQTQQTQIQIQTLLLDQSQQKTRLSNENASYKAQLSSIDESIKYAKDWQKAVQTQDQNLMDDVATVNGTVSIRWISLWELAQLYLPGYWIPAMLAFLTLVSYWNDRRRFGTM